MAQNHILTPEIMSVAGTSVLFAFLVESNLQFFLENNSWLTFETQESELDFTRGNSLVYKNFLLALGEDSKGLSMVLLNLKGF